MNENDRPVERYQDLIPLQYARRTERVICTRCNALPDAGAHFAPHATGGTLTVPMANGTTSTALCSCVVGHELNRLWLLDRKMKVPAYDDLPIAGERIIGGRIRDAFKQAAILNTDEEENWIHQRLLDVGLKLNLPFDDVVEHVFTQRWLSWRGGGKSRPLIEMFLSKYESEKVREAAKAISKIGRIEKEVGA